MQEEGASISFFCVLILGQELYLDSPRIAESQGSPSRLRVEVAGMYFNPQSTR
jgi:hypothetical protein